MTISPTLLVFFPLLLGLWQETPFTGENTRIPNAPTFMTRDEVRDQARYYRELSEPELRSRVALELAEANNPAAVEVLSSLLREEQDSQVKGDVLHALDQLRHVGPCRQPGELSALMRDPRQVIRAHALALALAAGSDVGPVLDVLATEDSPFVQRLAWARLGEDPGRCPEGRLMPFLKSAQALARAGAATVLCRQEPDPDRLAELMALAKDPAVAVRAAVAEAAGARPDGAAALLKALAADAHASVRCASATALAAPGRIEIHLALSADADSEARRLACLRLRDYPLASVAEALLARFGDPVEAVRIAAEDSLIALKPAAAVTDRLMADDLDQPATRAAAARVLGALGVTGAAPRLREVLPEGGDHELIRRLVTALGELDDKDAGPVVCAQKAHPRPEVRRAVAWTLGRLARQDTFPVIEELAKDEAPMVYDEALTSMGRIGDPGFAETLARNLVDVSERTGRPQRRATAAWALARGQAMPGENVLRQFERLCLTRCIPVMGMSEFDADHVRAACAFAFVELAKRDAALKARAERIIAQMADPNQDPQKPLSGLSLQVFSRQALDYLAGRESQPEPVPVREVIRTVMPVNIRP
jgi:hypothetical protein